MIFEFLCSWIALPFNKANTDNKINSFICLCDEFWLFCEKFASDLYKVNLTHCLFVFIFTENIQRREWQKQLKTEWSCFLHHLMFSEIISFYCVSIKIIPKTWAEREYMETSRSWTRNFQPFTMSENSLRCSQEPALGFYSEGEE